MKLPLRPLSILCLAATLASAPRAEDGYHHALGLLGEGIIDEAIVVLEEHLDDQPEDARAWALLARAMERLWREAGGSYLALNDARDAWQRSLELDPFDVSALHGAASLDLTLGEYAASTALAMRALGTARLVGEPVPAGLLELAARARFGTFQGREHTGDDAWTADLRDTFGVVRAARAEAAGGPEQTTLALVEADLLVAMGLPELAIEEVFASLLESPRDVGLNQRLIDLHTANGLTLRLPQRYARLAEGGGMGGILAWYTGYVERLVGDLWLRERHDARALEAYLRCISWMDTAALLEPSFADGARGIRIQARVSAAWCRIGLEQFDRAERELFDLMDEHLDWRETPDGLGRTMIAAVSVLGDRFVARNRFGRASAVARRVVERLPEEGSWWNNLGFLLREYGTQVEAGVSPGMQPEQAEGIFRESWAAYERAVELLPEDARVVNDAALIQVYHVQDRLEYAEQLLRRSIELGEAQLPELEPDAPESERFPIAQAVGDAYQNLGYLYYHVLDRPAESREYWLASMATDSGDRSSFQTYVDAIDGKREAVDESGQGGAPVPGPRPDAPPRPKLPLQGSLDQALGLAGAERPVLIYRRGQALGTSILLLDFVFAHARFVGRDADRVLLIADGRRHNFVDHRQDGRRLPCPRWPDLTCGEHLAVNDAFTQLYSEREGSEPGESEEGFWTLAPGGGELAVVEDVGTLLHDADAEQEAAPADADLEALVERAGAGDLRPLASDPRLAAQRALEALLFDGDRRLQEACVVNVARSESAHGRDLLARAIRQRVDEGLAQLALTALAPLDPAAVEFAERWSNDASVRELAAQRLEESMEGFGRRRRARAALTPGER